MNSNVNKIGAKIGVGALTLRPNFVPKKPIVIEKIDIAHTSEYNSVACKKIKSSEIVLQSNQQSIATSTENIGELLSLEQFLARFGCLHHCVQ